MGSENEIQRWRQDYRGGWYRHPEGKYVLHADHVAALQQSVQEAADSVYARETAARKADQERIDELEARVKSLSEANEHLTDRLNETRSYWIGQVEPQVEEQYAARLAAAEKLADAVDVSRDAWSAWFGDGSGSSVSVNEASVRVDAALAAFRASTRSEEG